MHRYWVNVPRSAYVRFIQYYVMAIGKKVKKIARRARSRSAGEAEKRTYIIVAKTGEFSFICATSNIVFFCLRNKNIFCHIVCPFLLAKLAEDLLDFH